MNYKVLCAVMLSSLCLTGCANTLPSQDADTLKKSLANSSAAVSAAASSSNFTVVDTGFFDISVAYLNAAEMFTNRDKEIGYDESSATLITLADNAISCSDKNVSINDNIVIISAEDTYLLSGSLSDGMIIVDAADTDKIQLVLDSVDINCNSSAAIYVKNADKVFITLASGSVNNLSSKQFLSIDDNNIDGAIFTKSDLTINGSGSLTVQSPNGHGIVSKDDLKITGGTYHITASSSALSGKDSVRIADGVFSLYAGKDGIHSENNDTTDKGFIYIEGGNFTMECNSDGFDASSTLQIDGGNFSLVVEDDAFHAEGDLIVNDGNVIIENCYEGLEGLTVTVNGGNITLNAQDDGINAAGDSASQNLGGFQKTGTTTPGDFDSGEMPSAPEGFGGFEKKYGFNPGDFDSGEMPSAPEGFDGFEKKDGFNPGDFGTGEMPSAPEGFDGFEKKDGFNPGDFDSGEMPSAPEGFDRFERGHGGGMGPGGSPFMADNSCLILINGGILHITAGGDGIDSNGNLAVTGGEVYVSGPSDNANSALDSDGNLLITGGVVVAAGSAGMAQNFGEDSTQGSMLVRLSSAAAPGDTVILKDSSGKELLSYTPEKTYGCVVLSCPEIVQGETYTLTAGSQSQTVKMDSLIYGNYGNYGRMH
ncbi:MAG: carbohydrate-binding domain-containing protein [Bacteroidales bacterium]|nr:carbohydrate-binding domain-containing protein [Lachnoclostridium sp.]MCM1384713.1 carbohydrate-binding domain-containing protein [Lachnoclostridium sp.]MCM1465273.1 carbohydrate-binding domain-containing protein [Bacteroidales bacterium]